jgi:hypothetical protein
MGKLLVNPKPEPVAASAEPVRVTRAKAEPVAVFPEPVAAAAEPMAAAAEPVAAAAEPARVARAKAEPVAAAAEPARVAAFAEPMAAAAEPVAAAAVLARVARAKAEPVAAHASLVLRAVMHPTWKVLEACRNNKTENRRKRRLPDVGKKKVGPEGAAGQGSRRTQRMRCLSPVDIVKKEQKVLQYGDEDDILPPTHPDWEHHGVVAYP